MADSPNTTTAPKIPDRSTPADIVFDMEEDIRDVGSYARAVILLALGFAASLPDESRALERVASDMEDLGERLHVAYHRLHEALHHPDKAETEKRDTTGLSEKPLIGDLIDNFEKNASPTFKAICDMEEPLTALRDYNRLILEIASGDAMDTDLALGVQQIARNMKREIEAAEELRSGIFHATHPNRNHFERNGWPGNKLDDGAALRPE
jgi:hypothetical protein